jgi:hypothetical protein
MIKSPFVTEITAAYLTSLSDMINEDSFASVGDDMYAPLTLLKDLAQAGPHIFQFLVLKECEKGGGWTLQEGAFGPPPPSVNGEFLTYPNHHAQVIVLVHHGVKWDLVVPRKGNDTDFWYRGFNIILM